MSGFSLGRIAGIDVHVHPSWFIILLLVVWMLATSALPAGFPDLAGAPRLVLATGIALAFFLSLLAHELGHSLVAQARGIPVHRITFFLFGGMAQTTQDSRSPGEEFAIAIAGPVVSLVLAAAFTAVWWYGMDLGLSPVLAGAAGYIGALNLVLAVFNLLPGFPMDGGRVLRAGIWAATGDLTRATRWAARVGVAFALFLMGFGIWRAVRGDITGGVWLVLIGWFIRNAARGSYQQYRISRDRELLRYGWDAGREQGGL